MEDTGQESSSVKEEDLPSETIEENEAPAEAEKSSGSPGKEEVKSETPVPDASNEELAESLDNSYLTPFIIKRGPGRPRKDGCSPVQKRKHFPGRPRVRAKKIEIKSMLGPTKMEDVYTPSATEGQNEPTVKEKSSPDSEQSTSLELASPSTEGKVEENPQDSWPVCALCNLNEKSCLGQGELIKFDPTPGFIPHRPVAKARQHFSESGILSPERERMLKGKLSRKAKGSGKQMRGKGQRSPEVKEYPKDEISMVGYSEEPEISSLFESSGHVYVHYNCAMWSEGVFKTDDHKLQNVDKAVCTGSIQKCNSCQKFGATLRCHVPKCNHAYHYPCAVSSGTFQDLKSLMLLCPLHINEVTLLMGSAANCISCEELGSIPDILFCTRCGNHYHGYCLDPPVLVNPMVRSGWQCPNCKTCTICRLRGDETKMLMCDTCDKGYHMFCLKPLVTNIPKHGWKCFNCRVCGDCGARTPGSGPSSRWHMNFSVCDSCYQQRNKGVACPLCGKAYRQFSQRGDMAQCTMCRKFIHVECDPQLMVPTDSDYICPVCNNTRQQANISQSSKIDGILRNDSYSDVLTSPSKEISNALNEDSVSSMDTEYHASTTGATTPESENRLPISHHSIGKPPFGRFPGKRRFTCGRSRGAGRFAGKRRAKAVEFRRKRGAKRKIKSLLLGCTIPQGTPFLDSKDLRQDDEPAIDNKMVLCSANDEFVLCQDLCAMCGSFGQAEEGRLIACAQCGQCYHPYCVTVKVTKVILKKGWRCLDCTVCEGCGQPHDEGRLLLCDECDISYHTYCLNPPLEMVPQGNWKCRWCVVCVRCGVTDPGYGSQWQNNYTQCGPCASQVTCPVCEIKYEENDLVIQCVQCDRWLHGSCDMMTCEEDAEKCAEYGYVCLLCRPKDELPPHLFQECIASPSPPPPEPEPKPPSPVAKPAVKEVEPAPKPKPQPHYYMDGVFLSETGMHQIKSLTIEQPKRQRIRKPRNPSGSAGIVFRGRPSTDDSEDGKELQESDLLIDTKMEVEDDSKSVTEELSRPEDGMLEVKKKRQRKLHKLGIGGFVAKPRGRTLSNKEQDPTLPQDLPVENVVPSVEGLPPEAETAGPEKPKRRRRPKKKNPLEDSFPSYLQEAFFGKDLLVTSKTDPSLDVSSDDEEEDNSVSQDHTIILPPEADRDPDEGTNDAVRDEGDDSKADKLDDKEISSKNTTDDDDLKDLLPHDLPQDDELMDMLMNDDDDQNSTDLQVNDQTDCDQTEDGNTKDALPANIDSVLLSPHFNIDNMVSESDTLSGLPHMDSKDVEDVFKGVLSPSDPCGPDLGGVSVGSGRNISPTNPPCQSSSLQQNPLTPASGPSLGSPFSVPPPSPFPTDYGSPQLSEPPSPWLDPDTDLPSQSQKNIYKWESDEALGPNATISPVLYANLNCQNLRTEFPCWTDRAKQIAKIWRNLPPEKRQPYLDQGKGIREQKSPRETEQERQWKQMQAMRQQLQHSSVEQRPSGKTHQMSLGEASPADSLSPSGSVTGSLGLAPSPTSQMMVQTVQSPLSPAQSQRSPGPSRVPTSVSPLIQVSRVRPPIDPSRLPPSDPYVVQSPGSSVNDRFLQPTRPGVIPRSSVVPPRIQVPRPDDSIGQDLFQTPPHTPGPYPSSPSSRPSSAPLEQYSQSPLSSRSQQGIPDHFNSPPGSRNVLTHAAPQSPDPYAQPPGTPHPAAQVPAPRPPNQPEGYPVGSLGSYARTSVPPRSIPHQVDPYAHPPSTPRMVSQAQDQFGQMARPPHVETYTRVQRPILPPQTSPQADQFQQGPPHTPQPLEPFSPSPQTSTQLDPYATQVATPRPPPQSDMYTVPRPQSQESYPAVSQQPHQVPDAFKPLPPNDPYARQVGTPHPLAARQNSSETLEGDGSQIMARQQLRDLLQRQQIKKQQEQLMRETSRPWPPGPMVLAGRMPSDSSFRAPLPPGIPPRMPEQAFRHPSAAPRVPPDARLRMLIMQPRGQQQPPPQQWQLQQPRQQIPRMGMPDQFEQVPQMPLTPSPSSAGPLMTDTMVDFPQQPPPPETGLPHDPSKSLNVSSTPENPSQKVAAVANTGGTTTSGVQAESTNTELKVKKETGNDLQEAEKEEKITKKKTTAGDLVKEVEEQTGDQEPVISGEDDLDDDELLGLGNDFNILEYADPELDNAFPGEGEKSNILDEHLDLDDKEDDLDEEGDIKPRSESEVKELTEDLKNCEKKKETDLKGGETSDQANPRKFDQTDSVATVEEPKSDKTSAPESVFPNTSTPNVHITKSTMGGDAQQVLVMPKPPVPQQMHASYGKPTIPLSPVVHTSAPVHKPMHMPQHSADMMPLPPPQYQGVPSPRIQQQMMVGSRASVPGVKSTMQSSGMLPTGGPVPERPLLLQEQPLLLEDLVEQEKREQRKQSTEGMPSPQSGTLLSDVDFERLKADVLSGPPDDTIGGPPSILSSQPPMMNAPQRFHHIPSHLGMQVPPQQPPVSWQGHDGNIYIRNAGPVVRTHLRPPNPMNIHPGPMHHRPEHMQAGPPQVPFSVQSLPAPPVPPPEILTEKDRQQQLQYEQWLQQQHLLLGNQQKFLETEVGKLRKAKKALNARQRQLRKNGQELLEHDAMELLRISQEQSGLQKQLDQVRKQSRQHALILQEYRLKQQKMMASSPSASVPHSGMHPMQSSHSPLMPGPSKTPQSPMMSPSPLGPVPSPRMQPHSPSSLMQHSPIKLSSPSPHIPQMSPQQPSPRLSTQVVQMDSSPRTTHQMQLQQQESGGPFSEGYPSQSDAPESLTGMHQPCAEGDKDLEGCHNVQQPLQRDDRIPLPPRMQIGAGSVHPSASVFQDHPGQQKYPIGQPHRSVPRLGGDLVGQPVLASVHPYMQRSGPMHPMMRPPPPYPDHLRPNVPQFSQVNQNVSFSTESKDSEHENGNTSQTQAHSEMQEKRYSPSISSAYAPATSASFPVSSAEEKQQLSMEQGRAGVKPPAEREISGDIPLGTPDSSKENKDADPSNISQVKTPDSENLDKVSDTSGKVKSDPPSSSCSPQVSLKDGSEETSVKQETPERDFMDAMSQLPSTSSGMQGSPDLRSVATSKQETILQYLRAGSIDSPVSTSSISRSSSIDSFMENVQHSTSEAPVRYQESLSMPAVSSVQQPMTSSTNMLTSQYQVNVSTSSSNDAFQQQQQQSQDMLSGMPFVSEANPNQMDPNPAQSNIRNQGLRHLMSPQQQMQGNFMRGNIPRPFMGPARPQGPYMQGRMPPMLRGVPYGEHQAYIQNQMYRQEAPRQPNPNMRFGIRPGGPGRGSPGGGLPGGSPHTIGGKPIKSNHTTPASTGIEASPAIAEHNSSNVNSASNLQTLVNSTQHNSSNSFGGSTFHVGPSRSSSHTIVSNSIALSYDAEQLADSVFVSVGFATVDQPSRSIHGEDDCSDNIHITDLIENNCHTINVSGMHSVGSSQSSEGNPASSCISSEILLGPNDDSVSSTYPSDESLNVFEKKKLREEQEANEFDNKSRVVKKECADNLSVENVESLSELSNNAFQNSPRLSSEGKPSPSSSLMDSPSSSRGFSEGTVTEPSNCSEANLTVNDHNYSSNQSARFDQKSVVVKEEPKPVEDIVASVVTSVSDSKFQPEKRVEGSVNNSPASSNNSSLVLDTSPSVSEVTATTSSQNLESKPAIYRANEPKWTVSAVPKPCYRSPSSPPPEADANENTVSQNVVGTKVIPVEIKQEVKEVSSCQLSRVQCDSDDSSNGLKLSENRSASERSNENSCTQEDNIKIETFKETSEGDKRSEDGGEGGKQNVLLKQLLQNCPSAESQKLDDYEPPANSKPKQASEDPLDETSSTSLENKGEEQPGKKLSYLDIRRAQLEKEPTPPPEDFKAKRKRPNKKKVEGKDKSPTKKKARKGSASRAEEDYELFMETMMARLRALPPIRVLEPHIKPNFNVCPIFGKGDLNLKEPMLKGQYGKGTLTEQADFYSVYPFGSNPPAPPVAISSTPIRGFYNQEFSLRYKDLPFGLNEQNSLSSSLSHPKNREPDSPDTILSSSSPEYHMFDTPLKFIGLQLIDDDSNSSDRSLYSPTVPIIAPIPIKAVPPAHMSIQKPMVDEKDKENAYQDKENIYSGDRIGVGVKSKLIGFNNPPVPLKDSGNVAVTLTLTSAAAEDIQGILSSLAALLKIAPPTKYEIIERTTTPPSQKFGLYKKSDDSSDNAETLLDGKQRFCRHCDIMVLSPGIKKKASEMVNIPKDELDGDDVYFCSSNCYMQFALSHQTPLSNEEKEAAAVVSHLNNDDSASVMSESNDKDHSPTTPGSMDGKESESLREGEDASPKTVDETFQDSVEQDLQDTKESPTPEESDSRRASKHSSPVKEQEPVPKKWKDVRWKFWTIEYVSTPKYQPDSEEEVAQLLDFLNICIKPEVMPSDTRRCVLCHDVGDGETNGPARLLNMDIDKWVHLNCALWSAEVYETVNGALMNVNSACKRSVLLTCCRCHKSGATLKCFKVRCTNVYHFPCATKDKCMFFKDKTMLCPQHVHKLVNTDNVLDSVAVFRRVYIDRDEHKQVACMIHKGEQNLLRIGSLIFLNIGQLLPHQLANFHTPNCIYPVGYKIVRMYWSMKKFGTRSMYICSIHDVEGKPEFQIHVDKQTDSIYKHHTPKGVWQQVLQPIEILRKEAQAIKVFSNFITGEDLFGLTEAAVLRIIESLPGLDSLSDYNFRYGRSPLLELPLAINPTGCARSEPKLRTHFKRPHTLHTSNTTRSSLQVSLGGMEAASPYTKHFVHSKSSQYRKMKTEWRNNVYLARSRIQGLGLYAARDIEKHTMVIEYIGQLIRNQIAEKNEAIYEVQNRGVYMFRLDENRVIDATLCGGLARYMNHSCNPNCVAEVVQIDRENKILIIANRRISRGEELTYDYKFDVEDDQHKIPCLCGAPSCRKWMN